MVESFIIMVQPLTYMQNYGFTVVESASSKMPLAVNAPEKVTSDYYGRNVFNRAALALHRGE